MKTEELMIGDWVLVEEPTETINAQILAVHKHGITYETNYSGIRATNIMSSDYIHPIFLTEEILVKNGFQKLNDKTFLLKDQIEIEVHSTFSEVYARYEDYDRDYNSYNDCYIEIAIIHYVHELQHLLRLIGIEKELMIC